MAMRYPEVRYADADGASLAYEVRGHGVRDIVRVSGVFPAILASAIDPELGAADDHLATFARVITYDRRGVGMSDPVAPGAVATLEQEVADLVAVLNSVGSVRATVIGSADGGQAAMLFAAMYPERVDALVLINAFPRWFRSHDYPFGFDEADAERIAGLARQFWGRPDNPWGLAVVAPSRIDDPEFRARYARWQQYSASPATGSDVFLVRGNDVRTVLPSVQARTLVLHPAEVPDDAMQRTLFLADLIDGAVVATFPGEDLVGADTREAALVIEEFVTGAHAAPVGDRVLATVLFTDIVSSTDRLSVIGDQAWRAELDGHDAMVRERLAEFRGREIDTAGDGFFAVFDGPAQAIRCAQAIIEGAHALGIDVRAGVHTGECEARGGGYAGIAVHTGARVAALAGDGEVYATRTVKDLVAGSGIVFEDCGVHQLKGIPEPWQLFRVVPG